MRLSGLEESRRCQPISSPPPGGALVDLFAAPDRAAEISDPCEAPDDAEITLDTAELTAEGAAQKIVLHLEKEGYVPGEPADRRSWSTR